MRKGKLYSLLFVLMGLACACLGFGLKNDSYAQATLYGSGGSLYFSSGARGTISGTINGGVSPEAGGGIYIGSGANVTLTSTGVIKNCFAGTGAPGGAVYNNGGTFNLNGTIQDCNDGGYGGSAVFMDGGTLNLGSTGKLVEFESSNHSLFRIDGGFATLAEGFTFEGCTGHHHLFYIDGGELNIQGEGNLVGPFLANERIYVKTLTSFPSGGEGTIKFSNGGGFTGKITSDYANPFVVGVWDTPSSSAQYNFVDVPEGKEGYAIAYLDQSSYFNASNWNVEGYDVELGTYNGSSAVLLKSSGYTINFDLGLEYCSPYNMVDTYFQTGWGGTTRSGFPGDFSIEILDEDTIKLNGNIDGSETWLSICEAFIPYGTTFKASVQHVSGTASGADASAGFEGYLITASSPEAHEIGMQGSWSSGYFMGTTSGGEANTQSTIYRWAGIKFYDPNGSVTFDDYVIDLEFKLFSDTNIEAEGGRTVELTEIGYGEELPAINVPPKTWMDDTKGYGTIAFQGYYTGKNGTGTCIYDANGNSVPADFPYQNDTILYGYWTYIPIAEVRVYSDTLNLHLCAENPSNMNYTILQEYDICGYATYLTKFYTHKGSSGANGYGANTGSFYAYFSAGAETTLGCPGQRDWRQWGIAFEDDFGTKEVIYEASEGNAEIYSSERTVIQIDLIATARPVPLYFSNGNSSGGTVNTSTVSATYGSYATVTTSTGTLKIYNSSGSLISTKTPTLASGYTTGYWRVYAGTNTTGDYSLLHNGKTKNLTNTAGYSFKFYPVKTTERTVTITTTMSDLYVNGSIYSSSSPTYTVTNGGTITLQTTLPYVDNSVTIAGPEGAYYRYYMWTVYVDGEEYYSQINKTSGAATDRIMITVTANMEIEVEKKTTLIIGANYALPDIEYGDIEQDKELEIISCLYDDKRYWFDKKYLTTGAMNNTSQEDLFQLEKYEIGSIEVQR